MKRFVLTARAQQDARDNSDAADRVLDAYTGAMIRLAKNPGIGHWREELTDRRHRFLLDYSYLVGLCARIRETTN